MNPLAGAARSDFEAARACLLTSFTPGAIAVIQLTGDKAALDNALPALTGGKTGGPVHCMRVAKFSDAAGEIDAGLVARITPNIVHLMPHGGPRVVQRILARCAALGIEIVRADTLPASAVFPDAEDEIEALMLCALGRARSPLAVELLLDQPHRWRAFRCPSSEGGAGESGGDEGDKYHSIRKISDDIHSRSARLNRLITPPLVVLAGAANVGKSTLSNKLLGRSMSIAVDQPGTTRDYTAGAIELGGLVVIWHDTPGLRITSDPIEAEAIELARHLMQRADFLVAMTDHEQPWPELPRKPDLRVACKCDIAQRDDAEPRTLNISNQTGEGIARLVQTVRDLLVPPDDIAHPGPWLFDERLLRPR